MEIVIAILLVIIAVQLYHALDYLKNIRSLLGSIEGGLVGNGYGGLSKLSYLEYIHTELEKLTELKGENKSKIASNF